MANAMKCDRCGKYYDFYGKFEENEPNGMALTCKINATRIKAIKRYDLCLDCLTELDKFIGMVSEEGGGEENNGSDQEM